MVLFFLSYLGGAFTIVSPCILPVLPFVFARADQPFLKSGLPLLLGMAVTFAGVASLAAVGGGWAVQANGYGRIGAMVVLAFFGLMLLFPALADRATRPLVALGSKLSTTAAGGSGVGGPFAASFLLGIATGLLWAPCAGPILGLLLTGAALQGASVKTTLLLLAYAAGAATSLALALLVGGRVFAGMKKSLKVGEWIRRVLGVLVLCGVVAIGFGADTGILAKLSTANTAHLEQWLVNRLQPTKAPPSSSVSANGVLPIEGDFPTLAGAVTWINSPPLTPAALRGKVVMVDFWTYSCINCLRTLPYVKAWAEKYKDQGLVVIGVHTPEFAFEKDIGNVQKAVHDLGIVYPVAIDNNDAVWRSFKNLYWPAHYFIDGEGHIRAHHYGEGDYPQAEAIIQKLLAENGSKDVPQGLVSVAGTGVVAAASINDVLSHETYVGFNRTKGFESAGGLVQNTAFDYPKTDLTARNAWSLTGDWSVGPEHATLQSAGGRLLYRFHARDLHLVLGPSPSGAPVRFRVLIDGKTPGANHGSDIDAQGRGVVTTQKLYQLIRQQGPIEDRTFEIEFLSPGVQAFVFTFG